MTFSWKSIFNEPDEAFVLMYHRIADVSIDPWDLCVSPENFEQQVRYLSEKFKIVPMQELAARLEQKKSVDNLVALTFDDGYLDNYTVAKPILEKYNVPATFYLTCKFLTETQTVAIDTKDLKSYWWDELEQIILHTTDLPESIVLPLNSTPFSFYLDDDHKLSETTKKQISEWRHGNSFYNNRIKLFFELCNVFKTMLPAQQTEAVHAIKAWANVGNVSTPSLMTESQIKHLASIDLFEIGAHTANHPALGYLSDEQQKNEIEESKKVLEALTKKRITGFAYPHGNFNDRTLVILNSFQFQYAVSTAEKHVDHDSPLYDIPRYQAKNFSSLDFKNMLKAWQHNH